MNYQYFVDTVCWIALLNKDDELHEKAASEYEKLCREGYNFITSTFVLTELANSLSQPKFKPAVINCIKRLYNSKIVDIVFVDELLYAEGWKLYTNRKDKSWSLTDCISIVIMQEEKVYTCITNDEHFFQAGFTISFKDL